MVDGDFQESLQQFVAYGYCLFGHVIHVAYHSPQEGETDYTIIPLSEFFTKARCPPTLAPSRVVAPEV